MPYERRLHIPAAVPEDFAQAVVTVLLLGMAGGEAWDLIYSHPPATSLRWIEGILRSNDSAGLVRSNMKWWENQLQGH